MKLVKYFEFNQNDLEPIKSFYLKDELNPKIWDNSDDAPKSHMKLEVKNQLDEIAEEFIKFVNVDMFVQDIIITGSLCNYNWSEYSDVDLHIIVNFDDFGEQKELYTELFKLKKTLFNSSHNITIKGFEVELYIQDSNEAHFSSGVYSVESMDAANILLQGIAKGNTTRAKMLAWVKAYNGKSITGNTIKFSANGDISYGLFAGFTTKNGVLVNTGIIK